MSSLHQAKFYSLQAFLIAWRWCRFLYTLSYLAHSLSITFLPFQTEIPEGEKNLSGHQQIHRPPHTKFSKSEKASYFRSSLLQTSSHWQVTAAVGCIEIASFPSVFTLPPSPPACPQLGLLQWNVLKTHKWSPPFWLHASCYLHQG